MRLTTEKFTSRKIDSNEPHHKLNKKFSEILRKKKHETGLQTLCHHFSLTILFWLPQISEFTNF